MAVEIITTGVIIDASTDVSVVKVPIDNTDRKFSFSKKMLYTFGMKCEGHMSNILEEGMEVNVLYKLCPDQNPNIVAVWLGNKPDKLEEDVSMLKPIFGQTGRLVEVEDDHVIVECDDFQKVFVKKSVVYRAGYRLDVKTQPVFKLGEGVTFDAVPLRPELEVASYTATCAWLGVQEPRLVDRFGLAASDQEDDRSEEDADLRDRVIEGTVSVIPRDTVAFVDVILDGVTDKILLFRSCFRNNKQSVPSQGLKDIVAVGDALTLKIAKGYLFSGRKHWFVTHAWKHFPHEKPIHNASAERLGTKFAAGGDVHVDSLTDLVDDIAVNNSPEFTESSKALFNDPPLCGLILRLSSDSASISFRNLIIFVQMKDVYVDGSSCTPEEFTELVSSGQREVKFEAAQSLYERKARRMESYLQWILYDVRKVFGATHTASCAWIGEKPSLSTITSALDPPDFSLLEDENRTFIGYVFNFCLPEIALIHLPQEGTVVILHLSEFVQSPEKPAAVNAIITDFVKLGEYFEFKIRRWNHLLFAFNSLRPNTRVLTEFTRKTEMACNDSETVKQTETQSNVSSDVDKLATNTSKSKLSPFGKSHTFNEQFRLLHCKGKLTQVLAAKQNGDIVVCFQVTHELGCSSLIYDPVVGGDRDKTITSEAFSVGWSHEICFDAEVFGDASHKLRFRVERMWFEKKGCRPQPENILRDELLYKGKKVLPSLPCVGTVHSIPLYDCAIAVVKKIPVLVTLKSVLSKKPYSLNQINPSSTSIDSFLKVGDEVKVRVVKSDDCYRAQLCWSFKSVDTNARKKNNQSNVFSAGRNSLLIQSWSSSCFYGKGIVTRMRTGYFVQFTTPLRMKKSETLVLDLFANNKVFVDGQFISLCEADRLVGRELSFYVAYSSEKEEKGIAPYGMFVDYAWTGNKPGQRNPPLPWAALDGRLSVPKGVLCSNALYEAVVELVRPGVRQRGVPYHAVCSIGPLPILVPNSAVQHEWVQGERVLLRVQEESYGTETALVCTDVLQLNSFTNVLKYKGKVASSPNPIGIIKTVDDVNVCFELCQVQDKATFGCDRTELSAWFKRVSEATHVGATVYFTAVKVNEGTGVYRALEVWVENTEELGNATRHCV